MKHINTKNAPGAIGPYSQAIVVDNMIYTSGQIPINPETGLIEGDDIVGQTNQVIKNVASILEEAGSSLADVVKTTVFISDMNNFQALNEIYSKYFINKPAISCVEVSKLPKNVLVEIEAIAIIKA